MIQMKNKKYLRQSERVIELIHHLENQNAGMFFLLYVAMENHIDDADVCEFRRVLWTKLEMSRYSGVVVEGFITLIDQAAENTYFIRCNKQHYMKNWRLGFAKENQVSLCISVDI